ncbi:MAG: FliO/MopB family protein [Thermoleophilia bacterium]|nr:FliO/MopB family protein [Thermoleophilia bacterium]
MGLQALIGTMILAVMVIVMYFLARIAKKRMGIGAGTIKGDALRIVGKKPLDQKSNLFVIEIAGGRHILLASSAEGHVVKLDDISPDEYAAMVDQETIEAAKAVRPKLKLAMPVLRPGAAPAQPVTGEPDSAVTAATVADVSDVSDVDPDAIVAASLVQAQADDAEAEEQRFATVGESFQLLLGKAKEARAARKEDRASGE